MHLGQGDIWKKKDSGTIIGYAKQTIWNLLNTTNSKLCVSLLIPLVKSKQQNIEIRKINEEITAFITDLRKDESFSDRIYSSNNNSLSGYIKYSTGAHGKYLDLNKRGLAKLWLMMRDSLRRTLGMTQALNSRQKNHSVSRNVIHHE